MELRREAESHAGTNNMKAAAHFFPQLPHCCPGYAGGIGQDHGFLCLSVHGIFQASGVPQKRKEYSLLRTAACDELALAIKAPVVDARVTGKQLPKKTEAIL